MKSGAVERTVNLFWSTVTGLQLQ